MWLDFLFSHNWLAPLIRWSLSHARMHTNIKRKLCYNSFTAKWTGAHTKEGEFDINEQSNCLTLHLFLSSVFLFFRWFNGIVWMYIIVDVTKPRVFKHSIRTERKRIIEIMVEREIDRKKEEENSSYRMLHNWNSKLVVYLGHSTTKSRATTNPFKWWRLTLTFDIDARISISQTHAHSHFSRLCIFFLRELLVFFISALEKCNNLALLQTTKIIFN